MATFNYQEMQQMGQNGLDQGSQVSFFGLKNNKDEAIVRFAFDSLNELEFATVHNVSIGGKYRKANCIRENLSDPVDRCPLCRAGMPLQKRVFIKLIQYNLDQLDSTGKPTYSPKVWDRSANFARQLSSYIANYGTLSDYVFKIVRNGNAGDTKTTYDIMPCMPQLYNPELYVKDFSAFANYSVVGTIILNEDYRGLQQILNGTYQPKTREESTNTAPVLQTATVGNNQWVPNMPFGNQPATPTVQNYNYTEQQTTAQPTTARPKRTYTY